VAALIGANLRTPNQSRKHEKEVQETC